MIETNKIPTLKKCLDLLRNEDYAYNWHSPLTDNVGFVALAMTGYNQTELLVALTPSKCFSQLWTDMVRLAYYDTDKKTGLPKNEVFAEFYKAGFTRQEIHELEFLSNETIKKDKLVGTALIAFGVFVFVLGG